MAMAMAMLPGRPFIRCSPRRRSATSASSGTEHAQPFAGRLRVLSLRLKRLLVGAEIVPEGVHFRVWAPQRSRVVVTCEGRPSLSLRREGEYFTGTCSGA